MGTNKARLKRLETMVVPAPKHEKREPVLTGLMTDLELVQRGEYKPPDEYTGRAMVTLFEALKVVTHG
jgi:hypothetical protein